MSVPKSVKITCCTPALTLSTEKLGSRRFFSLPWHYRMVASSHRLYAKLRNHHFGSWKNIRLLFISHTTFSLLGAASAAISNWACFLCSSGIISSIDPDDNVEMPVRVVQSLQSTMSRSASVSRVTTIRSCTRVPAAVVFLKLQYSGGSPFPVLMVHSLWWRKEGKVSAASAPCGFIVQVNSIVCAITQELQAQENLHFINEFFAFSNIALSWLLCLFCKVP